MWDETIKTIELEHSIEVYWDKVTTGKFSAQYNVTLKSSEDGRIISDITSDKTHVLFDNLPAGCDYDVTVKWDELELNAEACTLSSPVTIDVTAPPFNCVGDGKTMNTMGLQSAFDACPKGGRVYVPEGTYLTGALDLHSDMELFVDREATILGTADINDYLPKIWSRFEGTEMECYRSLLNLGNLDRNSDFNCKNVVITGGGTICGGGADLAKATIRYERERLAKELSDLGDKIKEYEHKDTIPGRMRGRLINMSNCSHITITDVTLKNGASWNVHFIYSEDIVTSRCTFISEGIWNGDGWDPDSSENCTIFGCKFFTGDDSVAVKSGKNPEGNVVNRPTRHIRIFDCACAYGHGIAIGSEMSGGIEDIKIWDCDMGNSMSGIEIKATKKRGGYVRDIVVDNTIVSHISFHSVCYNDDGIGAPQPPIFKNCSFSNLEIWGELYNHERERIPCHAIELIGFEEPGHELKNVTFESCTLGKPGQPRREQTLNLGLASGLNFTNLKVL